MLKFLFVASLLVAVALAQTESPTSAEEIERYQNENAKYSFENKIEDQINGGQITREETRDGSKVTGSYSYSDGFVKRTVHYEADENGYRVVKEDTQPIGEGPQFNPEGQADVQGSLIGSYSIKLDQDGDKKHYKDIRA
ncbi:cuticle protein 7-like [Drosophila tropicalis]|uniref:cuticle protein 7-like n=1 Tax=Drosophila tropicalis TaxID=46794 RepID=UPI0035AC1BBA